MNEEQRKQAEYLFLIHARNRLLNLEQALKFAQEYAEWYHKEQVKLPYLQRGDKIKLYNKETTVEGFGANWNEAFQTFEIILYTTGRGDPFKRTLKDIEIIK